MRRVVCAANRYGSHIFLGARHFDDRMREAMEDRNMKLLRKTYGEEQGFIDQFGTFMDRVEACQVAELAGQIIRRVGGDNGKLFSENLY